jgi:hypothetical protein
MEFLTKMFVSDASDGIERVGEHERPETALENEAASKIRTRA